MNRAWIVALFLLAGCTPRQPDPSLILWEQPSPEIAASAHAREKGLVAHPVAGRSMEPYLVAGDWVVVDIKFPFAALREGDVIVFEPDWYNGMVIHRLAARSGDAWKTDGINNGVSDPWVFERNYWGKMVQAYTRRAR